LRFGAGAGADPRQLYILYQTTRTCTIPAAAAACGIRGEGERAPPLPHPLDSTQHTSHSASHWILHHATNTTPLPLPKLRGPDRPRPKKRRRRRQQQQQQQDPCDAMGPVDSHK
jgi:hypothetical protein